MSERIGYIQSPNEALIAENLHLRAQVAAPWFRLGMLAVVTGTYGLGKIEPAISRALLEANVNAMRETIEGFLRAVDQAKAEGAGVEQDTVVQHWFDRLREVLVVIKPQQAARCRRNIDVGD